MTSLIERAAKAMQESPAWPAVFKAGSAEILARAAIEAMREPTPEMLAVDQFECSHPMGEMAVSTYAAQNYGIWQAMIDAALKEPPE